MGAKNVRLPSRSPVTVPIPGPREAYPQVFPHAGGREKLSMKSDFPRLEVPESLRREMVEVARQFRKEATKSEQILWQALRGKKLDRLKFRRQQPIGLFVVDFYNSTYRLVIEVDGPIHDLQKQADQERQAILETLGLNVLRIKAELVEGSLNAALEMIRAKIRELESTNANSPSPILGEGKGGGR